MLTQKKYASTKGQSHGWSLTLLKVDPVYKVKHKSWGQVGRRVNLLKEYHTLKEKKPKQIKTPEMNIEQSRRVILCFAYLTLHTKLS